MKQHPASASASSIGSSDAALSVMSPPHFFFSGFSARQSSNAYSRSSQRLTSLNAKREPFSAAISAATSATGRVCQPNFAPTTAQKSQLFRQPRVANTVLGIA